MRFESEVIADDLLPAIRSIIAERLLKDYGLTQEEIAARLEITQPAVSQYINGERADQEIVINLRQDPQIDILLDEAVSEAAQDQSFLDEVRQVVETVRDKGILKNKFDGARKI